MNLLLQEAFKVKNLKLAKIIMDKSNLEYESFSNDHYYSFNVVSFLANKESFNFAISYLTKTKRLDILKRIFNDSSYVSEISKWSNARSFTIIRKYIKRNWFFLNRKYCLELALNNNNFFVVKELVKLAKEQNIDIGALLPPETITKLFNQKESNLRIIRFLSNEISLLGDNVLKKHMWNLSSSNKSDWLRSLKRILKFFKIKSIDLFYYDIDSSKECKECFFFLYKKAQNRSVFFQTLYSSPMFRMLDRTDKIDKEVAKFLLKQNLKSIS